MSKPSQPKPAKGLRRWLPRTNLRPIRRALKEDTAGGIIYRRRGKVELLMIQDIKGRWTIPKGHVEEGERNQETAIREIEEETGLKNMRLIEWLGKIKFQYRRGDALVLMSMHVFLIEAVGNTDDLKPLKVEGIKAAKWFTVAEALDLIEYEDISKLMLLALKKIRHGA